MCLPGGFTLSCVLHLSVLKETMLGHPHVARTPVQFLAALVSLQEFFKQESHQTLSMARKTQYL